MITMDIDCNIRSGDEPQQLPLERWDDARMLAVLLDQDDLYRQLIQLDAERRAQLAEYKELRSEIRGRLDTLQEQIRAQRTPR